MKKQWEREKERYVKHDGEYSMVYIIMRTSRDDLSSPIGTTPLRSVKPNVSQKSNSSLILFLLLCFFFGAQNNRQSYDPYRGTPRWRNDSDLLISYELHYSPSRSGFLSHGAQIEVKWLVSPFHLTRFGSNSHMAGLNLMWQTSRGGKKRKKDENRAMIAHCSS